MKKLYSLIAAVAFTAVINAQGTENLNLQPTTAGTSYGAVSFSSADNTSWNLATVRVIDTSANFNIEGVSALFNANGTATITFTNGVGLFKFQYRKAFTGGTARSIQLTVDGTVVDTTTTFGSGTGAQANIYDYSFSVNKPGNVVVEVKVLGAQTTLDNFEWTLPVLSVNSNMSLKKVLVKNTSFSNELLFGAKADVQIINMNGQVVKSASVNENSKLNVSSLSKGMYVVTATVDGEKISQKIVKN